MAKVRVGFIGCGGRNRRGHMGHMSEFDDVEMAAVCDPVEEARNGAADQYSIEARYSSVDEMLDAGGIDAVVVATPAHLNGEAALPCLERGVDTLIEKPPGMSAAEATLLRDTAKRTGAKGMVGFQRRFHPMVLEARALIEERGPVTQILGEFHKSMTSTEASGRFPEIMLDNVLLETPIHSIDLVRAMAGSDVAEVHSVVRRALSSHKDVHAALVVFENGCVAQIAANYTGPERLQRYEVHGRDISAYLVGISEGWVVTHEGRVDLMDPAGSGGGIELDRFFIDCVKNDRPISAPAADLDEAVKTMDLAEAILSGLRE